MTGEPSTIGDLPAGRSHAPTRGIAATGVRVNWTRILSARAQAQARKSVRKDNPISLRRPEPKNREKRKKLRFGRPIPRPRPQSGRRSDVRSMNDSLLASRIWLILKPVNLAYLKVESSAKRWGTDKE